MSEAKHTLDQSTEPDFAAIAHSFGGFFESGAWRFPSPDRLQSFLIALQAAVDIAALSRRATQPSGGQGAGA